MEFVYSDISARFILISCCSFFPSLFYLENINNKFRPIWNIVLADLCFSPFVVSLFRFSLPLPFHPPPPPNPPPLPLPTQATPDIQDNLC